MGGRSEEVGGFPSPGKASRSGQQACREGGGLPLLDPDQTGQESWGGALLSQDARTGVGGLRVGNFGMCPMEPMQMRPVCM